MLAYLQEHINQAGNITLIIHLIGFQNTIRNLKILKF